MNRMNLERMKQKSGLRLVKKPSESAGTLQVVREATTGRVVVFSHTGNLPKVWAVAEPIALVSSNGNAVGYAATPPDDQMPSDEVAEAAALPVEVAFYRKYTEAMLRRYLQMSTEVGRVPSLLGRELFRGNVTHCKVKSFEDVVIFCHDMEKLIAKLTRLDQQLLLRIALQEYSQGEAAAMLGISVRNGIRLYFAAIDRLTEMLLKARMLEPLGEAAKSCQDVETVENLLSESM
jgi:predicted DNA-binding protein (UPF0251 family)